MQVFHGRFSKNIFVLFSMHVLGGNLFFSLQIHIDVILKFLLQFLYTGVCLVFPLINTTP